MGSSTLRKEYDSQMTWLQWEPAHQEDILCMALLRPTTVVTGSYDGDLVVWSLDNGHTVVRFNADRDTGPLRSAAKAKTSAPFSRRRRTYTHTHTHTHTHTPVQQPLVWDYQGEPVPER